MGGESGGDVAGVFLLALQDNSEEAFRYNIQLWRVKDITKLYTSCLKLWCSSSISIRKNMKWKLGEDSSTRKYIHGEVILVEKLGAQSAMEKVKSCSTICLNILK